MNENEIVTEDEVKEIVLGAEKTESEEHSNINTANK
jgi:hypothetical protein